MEIVTLDQAELVFSLFVAQNADRKISEFVENYNSYIKISELTVNRRNKEFTCLEYRNWNYFSYVSCKFYAWRFATGGGFIGEEGSWASIDIMKYISLEDKV